MKHDNGIPAHRFKVRPDWTIGEACVQASSFLAAHGVEEARSNAELLLLHALGLNRAALLRDWREPVPQQRIDAWETAVERKAAGEPAQYIIGEQWFFGRPFTVTPAVLIPRPETELLVEAVLETADRLWPQASGLQTEPGGSLVGRPLESGRPTVLDVGTGSGAIALTLAAERPRWRVVASDISPDALAVSGGNADRLGVDGRVSFVQGDLLEPFLQGEGESGFSHGPAPYADGWRGAHIDVLVSNPPYIPQSDLAGLQREVREFEPHLALDGGEDGLAPYRKMLEQLPLLAAVPRIVAFELGMGQAREVAEMLRSYGAWEDIRIVTDYGGIERHVIASG
ncbi:peptide chain release factor N(5)-glutamine methyltransferase [Paenibacillus beijingensis]|uniref:Release factor glutamine methyltransferase n=1 Tax=Paenibacillus beijingensis TaxID=1126833 RepID=A0A0D5NHX4_9BACL|nr:peptide chain release factor N(5)-glutamine methyltransferase [Paenibacillus beijingensis]AJY74582.1 SAM-dependent methyltransferase [Paenibacillus beijingensis]